MRFFRPEDRASADRSVRVGVAGKGDGGNVSAATPSGAAPILARNRTPATDPPGPVRTAGPGGGTVPAPADGARTETEPVFTDPFVSPSPVGGIRLSGKGFRAAGIAMGAKHDHA